MTDNKFCLMVVLPIGILASALLSMALEPEMAIPFLQIEEEGASVFLQWDPNTEADLAGYNVYQGVSSRDYGEPVPLTDEGGGIPTLYQVPTLPTGTYYFAVTAFNTAALESGFSNEVNLVVFPQSMPPEPSPRIESVVASNITTWSATIVWTTDLECSGEIFWGEDASVPESRQANNLGTTDHLAVAAFLQSRTHYFYKVRSVCGETTLESPIRTFNTK